MCSGCIESAEAKRARAMRQAEMAARIQAAEEAPPEDAGDDRITVVQDFTPRPIVQTTPAFIAAVLSADRPYGLPPIAGGSDPEAVTFLVEEAEDSETTEGTIPDYDHGIPSAADWDALIERRGAKVDFRGDGFVVTHPDGRLVRHVHDLDGNGKVTATRVGKFNIEPIG